jgi:hypothetical protein
MCEGRISPIFSLVYFSSIHDEDSLLELFKLAGVGHNNQTVDLVLAINALNAYRLS